MDMIFQIFALALTMGVVWYLGYYKNFARKPTTLVG